MSACKLVIKVAQRLYKVVTQLCFGSICSSDSHRRGVEVNGGCLSVTLTFVVIILLLLRMTNHVQSVAVRVNTANLGTYEAS